MDSPNYTHTKDSRDKPTIQFEEKSKKDYAETICQSGCSSFGNYTSELVGISQISKLVETNVLTKYMTNFILNI